MANKPLSKLLPADLPENWQTNQIVAPTGGEVGLAEQYGYNYLMAQLNAAQQAINNINEAFPGLAEIVNGKIPLAQLPMDTVLSNTSEDPVQNKVIYAALADKVPTARKVNGKALSGDISLTAADVGARPGNWTPTAAQVGAAAANHSHTKSQITDFPSSMPPTAHNHDAGNITSGTLPIARGGTGATTAAAARDSLGIKYAPIAIGYIGEGPVNGTTVLGFKPKVVFVCGYSSVPIASSDNVLFFFGTGGYNDSSFGANVTFNDNGFSLKTTKSYAISYIALGTPF